ncbi:MAG: ATP-grasp domain-containing protein [Dermatophilaceae bacterium]
MTRPVRDDERGAVVLFGGISVVLRHARLVRECASRGLDVLVVTSGEEDDVQARAEALRITQGRPLAGVAEWLVAPSARVDEVVGMIRDRWSDRDMRAVVSCGEVFVEAGAQLADLLGLAGPGLRAGRVCRNKELQRAYLVDVSPWSVLVPAARRGRAASAVKDYPCVVKPVGRMSSSGVRRVRDAEELDWAVSQLGPEEPFLVEELVTGAEYSVESLVHAGRILWENITAKVTNEEDSPYFTEIEHVLPAPGLSDEARRALLDASRSVLERLQFEDGISHAEFRLSPRGPVLMEVAARVPGDGITLMLELATGEPIEPVLLDLALGVPTALPEPRRRVVHRFVEGGPGVLRGLAGERLPPLVVLADDGAWPDPTPIAPEKPPRVATALLWRSPGTVLAGASRESGERAASVVVDLPLGADVPAVVAAVIGGVQLDVESPSVESVIP